MTDLIAEVENVRQSQRMSQAEVAHQMGVSQGQYSKVVANRVPLAPKMATRMKAWLEQRDIDRVILAKCIEMMHLLRARIDAAEEIDKKSD
jgi:transcriptional regulator with XRE-family HTH domain